MSDQVVNLEAVKSTELVPGFRGKFLHSERMSFVYWEINKDAALPEHAHEHEQVAHMLEGEFKLVVNGKPHVLKTGDVFVICSQARHSGTAITDCRILDAFCPVREDYKAF
jgi:quercetin dioxygenase-like cupin family protein